MLLNSFREAVIKTFLERLARSAHPGMFTGSSDEQKGWPWKESPRSGRVALLSAHGRAEGLREPEREAVQAATRHIGSPRKTNEKSQYSSEERRAPGPL